MHKIGLKIILKSIFFNWIKGARAQSRKCPPPFPPIFAPIFSVRGMSPIPPPPSFDRKAPHLQFSRRDGSPVPFLPQLYVGLNSWVYSCTNIRIYKTNGWYLTKNYSKMILACTKCLVLIISSLVRNLFVVGCISSVESDRLIDSSLLNLFQYQFISI